MSFSFQPFQQITILGPGLLGGSLGLAIKKRKIARRVVVWGRRLETMQTALKRGAADRFFLTPQEAVEKADLVILCTPVSTMPSLVREFRSKLKKGALVTDVGSTKYDIVKQLHHLISGKAHFIGSHPMAGAEKEGILAAKANLFERAVCILTPLPRTKPSVLKRLTEFWESLGSRIRTTSPSEHDEIVAYISHLPHMVASALINLVYHRKPKAFDFIGNGFRDMTRIAASPAELWSEIAISNRDELRRCIDRMIEELETIRRHTANASDLDLRTYLRQSRQQRDQLKHRF